MTDLGEHQRTLQALREALGTVIRGKDDAIELLLVGVLAGGHVLLEDVPGVGKTTLAKAFARCLGFAFGRVQFTPDLLPTDIVGTQVLNAKDGSLRFQKGPVFAQVLLADEINRASPRTQSALLEAMSEGQVTVDGESHRLPEPFVVLATQNPADFQGTYPLPEAQLDRFVLRFSLGYPGVEEELRMLEDRRSSDPLSELTSVASPAQVLDMIRGVRAVRVEERVARYLHSLVEWTRRQPDLSLGVSPRGTLVLYRSCQARAFLRNRDYVLPDDVQALAGPVLSHRMQTTEQARYGGKSTHTLCEQALRELPVPV